MDNWWAECKTKVGQSEMFNRKLHTGKQIFLKIRNTEFNLCQGWSKIYKHKHPHTNFQDTYKQEIKMYIKCTFWIERKNIYIHKYTYTKYEMPYTFTILWMCVCCVCVSILTSIMLSGAHSHTETLYTLHKHRGWALPKAFARVPLLEGRALRVELLSSSCWGRNHHLFICR